MDTKDTPKSIKIIAGSADTALEPEGIERRRFLRVRPDILSAMLVENDRRHVVAIRDISTAGARVVNVPHELRLNDEVEIVARLDFEMVSIHCRVAHVHENAILPAIGVEFMDVDHESAEKLISYVAKLGILMIQGESAPF